MAYIHVFPSQKVCEPLEESVLIGGTYSVPKPVHDTQEAFNKTVQLLNEYYQSLQPHKLLSA